MKTINKKKYYIMHNVGKVKYLINFHDGQKTHQDGSDFYDIGCFSNKRKLAQFEKQLINNGYIEGRPWLRIHTK